MLRPGFFALSCCKSWCGFRGCRVQPAAAQRPTAAHRLVAARICAADRDGVAGGDAQAAEQGILAEVCGRVSAVKLPELGHLIMALMSIAHLSQQKQRSKGRARS